MTSEKFTTASETFTKNVNDTMKWLQDTTTTILETQSKQMKSASDIYTKAMNTAWGTINKENFNTSFGVSETIVEILQKNIETISNMAKASLKTAMEFGKQADSEKFSKETMTKIIESYKTQVEEITAFNKKSFEAITKQVDTTKTSFTPLAEKFKKEFETTLTASKAKAQEIIDTYSKQAAPSVEVNKEIFNKLNKQMNASVTDNLKLWSEFMNEYSTKASETKDAAAFFKAPSFNSKKKETVNNN
ncbi:MAG: hypothetical protein V4608_06170 [Bacteroidota bacterium]